MTDLGTLGGSYSNAFGINDAGQVVGAANTPNIGPQHAFLYSTGVMIDLNSLLPASSGWVLDSANAINNSGQIVGTGKHNGVETAFLASLDSSAVTISNVAVAEACPANGVLDSTDQVVITWAVNGADSVGMKSLTVDGNPVGTVYGPFSGGADTWYFAGVFGPLARARTVARSNRPIASTVPPARTLAASPSSARPSRFLASPWPRPRHRTVSLTRPTSLSSLGQSVAPIALEASRSASMARQSAPYTGRMLVVPTRGTWPGSSVPLSRNAQLHHSVGRQQG